jgi:hypothetical protein
MGWLGLLKVLLSLASSIANIVREKQLMDAGAARETALQLRDIADKAGIARAIEAETARMTPEDILRDLEQSGELRE